MFLVSIMHLARKRRVADRSIVRSPMVVVGLGVSLVSAGLTPAVTGTSEADVSEDVLSVTTVVSSAAYTSACRNGIFIKRTASDIKTAIRSLHVRFIGAPFLYLTIDFLTRF